MLNLCLNKSFKIIQTDLGVNIPQTRQANSTGIVGRGPPAVPELWSGGASPRLPSLEDQAASDETRDKGKQIICPCLYIHIYIIYIYIYVYIYMCIYVYINVYVYRDMYIYMYMYMYTHTYIPIHVYTNIYIYIYIIHISCQPLTLSFSGGSRITKCALTCFGIFWFQAGREGIVDFYHSSIWPWVKVQIVPPVNIPIPTKIGSKMGGAPTPKWYWF